MVLRKSIRLGDVALGAPLVWVVLLGLAPSGCYNSEALEQSRHEDVDVTKLAEVDLGEFHITLPQATSEAGGGVVDFHAFGRVARRDQSAVAQAVDERRAELRSRMLLALRAITAAELEEPALDQLREEIAAVINGALDKKLVKNVGFYSFSYTTL
jgi:hypothetical protein